MQRILHGSSGLRLLMVAPALTLLAFVLSTQVGRGNVVGYISVQVTNGYTFFANQLDHDGNNSIANVLTGPVPDGTCVYLWDIPTQTFSAPSVYHRPAGWDKNLDLSPGKGFVVWSETKWTNTFVGSVLEGTLVNFLPGDSKFSLQAYQVPMAGSLGTKYGFIARDGDCVYLYTNALQVFSGSFSFLSGLAWYDAQGHAIPDGPHLDIVQPFFVQRSGPDTNWIYKFYVNGAVSSDRPITGFVNSGDEIILKINGGQGPAYDIQFSPDLQTWTTVARKQTAQNWKGKKPTARKGYFRVLQP